MPCRMKSFGSVIEMLFSALGSIYVIVRERLMRYEVYVGAVV